MRGRLTRGEIRTAIHQPAAFVPRAEGISHLQDEDARGGIAPAAQRGRNVDQAYPQVIAYAGNRELAAVGQRPPQRLALGPARRGHRVGQVQVRQVGPQAAVGGVRTGDEVVHVYSAVRGVTVLPRDPVDRVPARLPVLAPAQQEVPVVGDQIPRRRCSGCTATYETPAIGSWTGPGTVSSSANDIAVPVRSPSAKAPIGLSAATTSPACRRCSSSELTPHADSKTSRKAPISSLPTGLTSTLIGGASRAS